MTTCEDSSPVAQLAHENHHAQRHQSARPNRKTRATIGAAATSLAGQRRNQHHHNHQQVRPRSSETGRHQLGCRHQQESSAHIRARHHEQQQPPVDQSATGTDLDARDSAAANFWPNHQHQHQYSCSQAQLQSLTGDCEPISAMYHHDDKRKSPSGRYQQAAACFGHNSKQQQQPTRGHETLASGSTTTKPMVTSVVPEHQHDFGQVQPQTRQPASLAMFANTRQHRTLPLVGMHRHHHHQHQHQVAATPDQHNVTPIGLSLLPPPYSADPNTTATTMLPSTSAVYHNHHQQQQHVICERPPPVQAMQPAAQQTTSHLPGQQQATMLAPAGNRNNPTNSNNSSNNDNNNPDRSPQVQQSSIGSTTHNQQQQQQQQQQRVLNFLSANNSIQQQQQQQGACNFPSLFGPQQHLSYLLGGHHHDQASRNATSTNPLEHCFQQLNVGSTSGSSKSRSCLTCADISIKWYIAVIALLGLICALIGTIVGAVHSAGRDYISLTLLLVGVGLVLVAISWIALRITVKTYKSSSSPSLVGRSSSSSHHHHLQQSHNHHHQQQQQQLNSVARLLAQGNQQQHRALLNERLYMVAAAAAALQLQTGGRGGGPHTSNAASPDDFQHQPPTVGPPQDGPGGGLIRGIKRRLPRRFARLIPEHRQEPLAASSSRLGSLEAQQQPPHNNGRAALAAAAALLQQFQQQQQPGCALLAPGAAHLAGALGSGGNITTRPNASANTSTNTNANANASAAATAAAAAAAFAFLYPPAGMSHLHPAFPSGEFSWRPPPPSYNAAMQDQRLRMLLQERIGLQAAQMSAMFPGSANPVPGPTSSSSGGAVRQSSGDDGPTATTTTTTPAPTLPALAADPQSSGPMRVTSQPAEPGPAQTEARPGPNIVAGLSSSSSSSSGPTLTPNDIYISSSPAPPPAQVPQGSAPGSDLGCSPPQSQSSPRNIGPDGHRMGARKSGAEAKILGYV